MLAVRHVATIVWVLGAVGALGYYARAIYYPPIRTPVGVETRLSGDGPHESDMIQSPGGDWVWQFNFARFSFDGNPRSSFSAARAALSGAWLQTSSPPRAVSLLPSDTAWIVSGDRMRPLGDRAVAGWLGARTAIGTSDDSDYQAIRLGDGVRTQNFDARGVRLVEEVEPWTRLDIWRLPALEEALFARGLSGARWGTYLVRRDPPSEHVLLQVTWLSDDNRGPLLAFRYEGYDKSVLVAKRAVPVGVSRDGRTLFFRRDNAIWRLDLRAPLDELLAEAGGSGLGL